MCISTRHASALSSSYCRGMHAIMFVYVWPRPVGHLEHPACKRRLIYSPRCMKQIHPHVHEACKDKIDCFASWIIRRFLFRSNKLSDAFYSKNFICVFGYLRTSIVGRNSAMTLIVGMP